jgi:hypothetical protein
MIDDRRKDDDLLESMFQQARAMPPEVPGDLMARIVADGLAVQPVLRKPLVARVIEALGGARGMGGLITATCVGFWLGVAPPEGVPDLAGAVIGIEDVILAELDSDAISGFGWEIGESD